MVKPRSSLTMPTYRPRRIWLNSVGAQNGEIDEVKLRKSLPYCDIDTGTKNRVVNRDPISGLGLLGKEYSPFQENRTRPKSARESIDRNPILGQGQLGEELNIFKTPKKLRCKQREYRNPLETNTCNKEGRESDPLRPKGKPTKGNNRQAQRDPISGRGNFGKEWDPIYGYSGRPRPWHRQPKDERDPITGNGIANSDILDLWRKPEDYPFRNYLDKPLPLRRTLSMVVKSTRGGKSNPVTGEDVKSFDINTELKRSSRPSTAKSNNPLTGENCKSFEISVESRPKTPRKTDSGNPLTGDKCESFSYSKEFKPKTPRGATESKNPLTGSNCMTYTYSTEDRPKTAGSTPNTPRSNPLTGENCQHFMVNSSERKINGVKAHVESNPVTGSNVKSYDIDQQMRVNRRPSSGSSTSSKSNNSPILRSPTGGNSPTKAASYNPITGAEQ